MKICCNEQTKEKIVVGIDFGTTNCLISYIDNDRKVQFIQQKKDYNLIPSRIILDDNKVIFGHDINEKDSKCVITSIKRIIGLTLDEVRKLKNELPFTIDFKNSTENEILVLCENSSYSVQNIVLKMFSCLKKIIHDGGFENEEIHTVITVPAYFDEKARSIIKKSAFLAGLIVIRLISEPTAAAISYSDNQNCDVLQENKAYLVYDLGGGTFDISIIKKYENNFFRVMGIGGDKFLGGDNFDNLIIDNLKTRGLFSELNDNEIKSLAKKIKEEFEDSEYFTKTELIILFQPLIEKTIRIMENVIEDYESQFEDYSLNTIILVGGSTRMQSLRDILSAKYGLLHSHNPDEIVAVGAALHAENIDSTTKNHGLIDAVGISFGLEISGGGVEKLIEKNTPIPFSKSQTFTTQIDNQKQMRISICQGESKNFNENILLGHLSLTDLPNAPAGKLQIEVTFTVDADGILSVRAVELEAGKSVFGEFAEIIT